MCFEIEASQVASQDLEHVMRLQPHCAVSGEFIDTPPMLLGLQMTAIISAVPSGVGVQNLPGPRGGQGKASARRYLSTPDSVNQRA